MRVLIITGSFKTGGAERTSLTVGQALLDRGYDVHYIVQRPIFEIPHRIPEQRIHVLRQQDRRDLFYKSTRLFGGAALVTRRLNPDVIVAFTRFSSLLACTTLHPRIIARFDMQPFELKRKQRIWANVVTTSPNARAIVVPSSRMQAALQQLRPCQREKFLSISNSVDNARVLRQAGEVPQPLHPFPYIAAMGRLSQQKNFSLLLTAYAQSRLRSTHKLIIVGDGPLRTELERQVASSNLAEEVLLVGQQSNPFPTIAGASLLVNTSSRESFCNVILEALALSTPVIATDCNYGPSELVQHDVSGLLVRNNDAQALTEALNVVSDRPETLARWRENASEIARKLDVKHVTTKWVDLIERVGRG